MKTLTLTKGAECLLDDEDFFPFFMMGSWCLCQGYAFQNNRYLHQILGAKLGIKRVDHEDRNKLNNQRYNLRESTHTDNNRNRTKRRNPTSSKYKCVSWKPSLNKWEAYITIDGKKKHLGVYDDEIDAAVAYDVEATRQFGEFAALNFPGSSK